MVSRWPIRRKLSIGVLILFFTLTALTISGVQGVYSYRGLVKAISHRASELPLATQLAQHVSELRLIISRLRQSRERHLHGLQADQRYHPFDPLELREDFRQEMKSLRSTLDAYRDRLSKNRRDELAPSRIYDNKKEWETVHEIEAALATIAPLVDQEYWALDGEIDVHEADIETALTELHHLSAALPGHLQQRMYTLTDDVRLRYRASIIVVWATSALSGAMLLGLCVSFFFWIFRPLRILIRDSRRVANGDFDHRIQLPAKDEMADLADAMNNMTARFQAICDDLDAKVHQRTKEVLRSEQLASVGFLAAGVAHEINNPLASIALCAESIEDRLHDIIQFDDTLPDSEHNDEIAVLRNYLRMMQDEAFRCKQITERLLDFSRLGDVEMQQTDLNELVEGVVSMVSHIGKYKEKQIEYSATDVVYAEVNAQELKQVVLNLLTNALESLNPGGKVSVTLSRAQDKARLEFVDNGCGMTGEVKDHLFEPFFTRRKGGQGTGLGLSISYRIIAGHGGKITAESDGPGCGSTFCVVLPLEQKTNEEQNHYQEAA